MPGFLIINPRAGDEEPTADELRDEAERQGIAAHVLGQGEDILQLQLVRIAPQALRVLVPER